MCCTAWRSSPMLDDVKRGDEIKRPARSGPIGVPEEPRRAVRMRGRSGLSGESRD